MMNPSSSSISDTIIDNTVVFPSLVEYIESIRFLPLEEQARRITDPVTKKSSSQVLCEMLIDSILEEDEDGHDQCHITAPCTHNGR